MKRISLKITGAQGQGINSVGEMCAKGLKRGGYCVFGYREYMSLIKGGHSSYQLDVSDERIGSSQMNVDILVCFNHHGLENNYNEVKDGGIILHQTPQWNFPKEQQQDLDKRDISVVYMPNETFLKELKAPPIVSNMLITASVWTLLGRSAKELKEMAKEQFGHKGEKILALNNNAIDAAAGWIKEEKIQEQWSESLPPAKKQWSDHLLITGSEAMGLGTIHAGVRMYVGYPMTPSSPLLSYIADMQNETKMVIKQAEDEITAAQMASGAMMMGTRALTGTSGGGFDLMSETLSLNGIIENPTVFVLAQRPGPGTGLPTWTGQGDLMMAIHTGHGEFTRCVLSASDGQDAFDLMPIAFNIAEEYQISVIVLTDKHIAEALYTQKPYDLKKAELKRGKLITDNKELAKLKATDRYDPNAEDGISPRWLPGSEAATFCAQGDEHSEDGSVDESPANAIAQMKKRMRKNNKLKEQLPEPELFGAKNPELLLVGWGSTKDVVLDALSSDELKEKSIGYLHYTYMWPLKTSMYTALHKDAKRTVVIEGNYQGQLKMLLTQESGDEANDSIRKYDGRPFFFEELTHLISQQYSQL